MKVTRVLCDRCQAELPEDRAEREGLELKLRYDPRGEEPSLLGRLSPFGGAEELDLCPECREAFADWLGDRGREVPGLVAPEPPEDEAPDEPADESGDSGDGETSVTAKRV